MALMLSLAPSDSRKGCGTAISGLIMFDTALKEMQEMHGNAATPSAHLSDPTKPPTC